MTRVVALAGGVGGAKLVLGLSRVMDPAALTAVVNTGDDFEHLGLTICPDLDTVTYTLAGVANPTTGWGRADETWTFMANLETLGGETWFRLGDGDLALHVERTRRLGSGEHLTQVTIEVCARLGISVSILPMSDDPVRTVVETAIGPLPFQHYFVREGCRPKVTGFRFSGAAGARITPAVQRALGDPKLRAVVICPSNPFISIDPILAVPGMRDALAGVPVIAVSPIVGGRAIKGPAGKMLEELDIEVSARSVWRHYGGLLDGFVLDTADRNLAEAARREVPRVLVTDTVMKTLGDRERLARSVLDFADGF